MDDKLKMNDVFMAKDIKCTIMPHDNKRTMPIPVGCYAIVADININGKLFEIAEAFKDSVSFEKAKNLFEKTAIYAEYKAKRRMRR